MRVKRRMARELITISRDYTIKRAMELMKKHEIRHLPVVENGRMVGMVTESDIRAVHLASMIEDITVADIMLINPIIISPDTPIEDAARFLVENRISGLPVIENDQLVGMITTTDICRAFIEIMGILESSSRIDVVTNRRPGAFDEVARFIREHGGEIISVGMANAEEHNSRIYFFRLEKCDVEAIANALRRNGFKIISIIP
ncbi:MAG: CBS domain-containing protein [Deltaproteobacteria bacterium]|nr:CBS domain-containing protein [Deltaproteobacteria bacterium]MBW2308159.1 CBS domain-containing protein [Deltaproteobacteria bacterium]